MIDASDFKKGDNIVFKGAPVTVVDVTFSTPTARGAGTIVKLDLAVKTYVEVECPESLAQGRAGGALGAASARLDGRVPAADPPVEHRQPGHPA